MVMKSEKRKSYCTNARWYNFSSGFTFKLVNDNKKDNNDALIESTTEFKYYNIDKKDR